MASGVLLLVEDHEGWHRSIARRAERAGFEVYGAYACAQAREIVSRQRFELAIVDVHLPDGLGFGLIPLIRQASPGCRVLMASGLPCERAARMAAEAGADEFATSTVETIERFLRGESRAPTKRAARPTLDEVKVDYINTVMLEVEGNRSRAASVLGVRRQSLQRMLRKHSPGRSE
jgi:ActR/RegA family two-component response regulator